MPAEVWVCGQRFFLWVAIELVFRLQCLIVRLKIRQGTLQCIAMDCKNALLAANIVSNLNSAWHAFRRMKTSF